MTERFVERIEMALGAMAPAGPRNLRAYLEKPGPDQETASPSEIDQMIDLILSADPNHPARLRFSGLIMSWDNTKHAAWTENTSRNGQERRSLIHNKLGSDQALRERIDKLLPFYPLEEPIIIAEKHEDWYEPRDGVHDYYWQAYKKYLRERRSWSDEAILTLDNATRAIVECLANPTDDKAYGSKGLVMGYVQSGKTSNFMGVVARAADAGYRLIIILAGTWNILRNQAQRRFDKELLGKAFLKNDEAYILSKPRDWDDFLDHDFDPVENGHFAWQRLTRPDLDFRRLKTAIDNLEFEKRDRASPTYSAINLYSMPAKLLVVKKHPGVLNNLVRDFKLLSTKLAELPVVVIDDESDQAGLNTINQVKRKNSRPPTNDRIVQLLKLFPRAQYIGYTATPYANALVDPDDSEDLFPKDFIVSLDRPAGYMGVSDFFDPATDYRDLDANDYSSAEIAFIRRVESPVGDDDEDLKKALRGYVLTGAIKLFRQASDEIRYKAGYFTHHTMLVHTTHLKGQQSNLVDHLKTLWAGCSFNGPGGMNELRERWESDFAPVSAAIGNEVSPKDFSELIPFLSESIKRIESGPSVFLLVNSDSPSAPDFNAGSVWKVIVGGNKLSRGYTVEGLTISYYRRLVGVGDTLMQMGRWFGFRPGYKDLVRAYLGVREGKKGDVDLVALFKEVCYMEEKFRDDIKRYVRRENARRITPREIPPLIAVIGDLPPTASNKMFNAIVTSMNFGGARTMPTMIAATPDGSETNETVTTELLMSSKAIGRKTLGGVTEDGKVRNYEAYVFSSATKTIVKFLKEFHWLEDRYKFPQRPKEIELQIEFLEKKEHKIQTWLILMPQRRESFGAPYSLNDDIKLNVKERQRSAGNAFKVFGEPRHRIAANYLAGAIISDNEEKLTEPNDTTKQLFAQNLGVMLLYPARSNENDRMSIGFELTFPKNDLGYNANFTVRQRNDPGVITVQGN